MTAKSAPSKVMVGGRQGQAFKDKSKPADIRQSNINAAKGEFESCDLKFAQFLCVSHENHGCWLIKMIISLTNNDNDQENHRQVVVFID